MARPAAIRTDYYTRLEQGRVQASTAALDILAQVLRLDGDQRVWNAMAAALVMDFGRIFAEERNYVRLLFTEPVIRVLYRDWADMARLAVAHCAWTAGGALTTLG